MVWGWQNRRPPLGKTNPVPNAIAYLMLAIWPVVTVALFRQLDPRKALIWTILAGYLLLPPAVAINLFWHAKYHRDPANLWLRQLLVELFADAPSPV